MRLVAPPLSAAAQYDASNLPLVVGGLVSLFVVVLLLFWRVSRKPQAAPPAPSQTPGGSPPQIVVPPPSQPVALSLEFTAESGQRIRFVLDKPTLTIGRAHDNDIVLAAPILNADTASQHHARLRRDQDDFIVRDLSSRNGLAVNGRQTIENLLQDGDRLQFGEVEATFHQSAGDAA
jgi:pSer/pThr/pTyr-binding forkhead associated (FHA) protein